jgi:hypothetical protein
VRGPTGRSVHSATDGFKITLEVTMPGGTADFRPARRIAGFTRGGFIIWTLCQFCGSLRSTRWRCSRQSGGDAAGTGGGIRTATSNLRRADGFGRTRGQASRSSAYIRALRLLNNYIRAAGIAGGIKGWLFRSMHKGNKALNSDSNRPSENSGDRAEVASDWACHSLRSMWR